MSHIYPSELELLILNVLWQAESEDQTPIPVREVRRRLAKLGRDLAHTSVITTLNVMRDKKFVKRRARKNAFVFSPKVSRDEVGQNEVGKLLNRVFDGSATSLMQSLLQADEVNPEVLSEMKKLISQAAKKRNNT